MLDLSSDCRQITAQVNAEILENGYLEITEVLVSKGLRQVVSQDVVFLERALIESGLWRTPGKSDLTSGTSVLGIQYLYDLWKSEGTITIAVLDLGKRTPRLRYYLRMLIKRLRGLFEYGNFLPIYWKNTSAVWTNNRTKSDKVWWWTIIREMDLLATLDKASQSVNALEVLEP